MDKTASEWLLDEFDAKYAEMASEEARKLSKMAALRAAFQAQWRLTK